MEGARLDHLAQYLAEARQGYVAPPVVLPGEELLLRLGGVGTPEVAEFTVCEVAGALGLSQAAATGLCADVLDLTFRLREVAQCVRAGVLPFVRARMIARRTRELSVAECVLVQARLMRLRDSGRGPMPVAALVPMGRLKDMVDQAVLTVRGPETVAQAEAKVAASLYVEVVHQAGGATDLAAADAARLDALLDEIAGWLAQVGDERPKKILRAVALGLLADPDLLSALSEMQTQQPSAGNDVGAAPDELVDSDVPAAPVPSPVPAETPAAAGIAGLPAGVLEKLRRMRSTVLYVHLDRASETWCEEKAGALSKEQARQIVGHSNVAIRPVLDLAEPLTYTGYVAPPKLKEQLALLNAGYCTFPYCTRRARVSDVDHRRSYATGGPTATANTHRPCRKHHRVKDKGGWRVVSPAPGIWIWTSPAGALWLVTNGTTTPLNGIFTAPQNRIVTMPPDVGSIAFPDGTLSTSLDSGSTVLALGSGREAGATPTGDGHAPTADPAAEGREGSRASETKPSTGSSNTYPAAVDPGASNPAASVPPSAGNTRGPKDAGTPTNHPLTPDEYDVTYNFIDTG